MVKYRRVKIEQANEAEMAFSRPVAMSMSFNENLHGVVLDWENLKWRDLRRTGEVGLGGFKIEGGGRGISYRAYGKEIEDLPYRDSELPHWGFFDLATATRTLLTLNLGEGWWEPPQVSFNRSLTKFAYRAMWYEDTERPHTSNDMRQLPQYPRTIEAGATVPNWFPPLPSVRKVNVIRVQDFETGHEVDLASTRGVLWVSGMTPSVVWSIDGTKLAGVLSEIYRAFPDSNDVTRPNIHFFDALTGETEWILKDHYIPTDAAWSHDGSSLIVANQGKGGFGILDLATRTIEWHDPNGGVSPVERPNAKLVRVLGFAPDGRMYCWIRLERTAIVVLVDLETYEQEELFRTSGCTDPWIKLAQVSPEYLPMPPSS